MDLIPSFLFTSSLSALLIVFLKPLAVKIKLLDHPCSRKRHEIVTPLTGGIAIFLTFVVTLLTSEAFSIDQYRFFLLGALMMFLMGLVDDIKHLKAGSRLMIQASAALVLCLFGDVVILDLGLLSGSQALVGLGLFAIPFTVFAVVGLVNAINMVDGIDGLAGSLMIIMLGTILALLPESGFGEIKILILSLMAAIVGFLIFNFPLFGRAKVFMGDTGSMFLGFVLAGLLIMLSQGENRVMSPVIALWIVALPVIDTLTVMIRRIRKGKSPFSADRNHFHHILQRVGFGRRVSLIIILLLASGIAVVSMVAYYYEVDDSVMIVAFFVLFFLYNWFLSHAWRVSRFVRKQLRRYSVSA